MNIEYLMSGFVCFPQFYERRLAAGTESTRRLLSFWPEADKVLPYLPPTSFVCGQNVMLSSAEYFSSQCMKQILSVKPKSIQIHDLDDRGKRGMCRRERKTIQSSSHTERAHSHLWKKRQLESRPKCEQVESGKSTSRLRHDRSLTYPPSWSILGKNLSFSASCQ